MKIDSSVVKAVLARTLKNTTMNRLQEITNEVVDGLNKVFVVQDQLELLRVERAGVVAEHMEMLKAIDAGVAKVQSTCPHACTSDDFEGHRKQYITTTCEVCGKILKRGAIRA